MMIHEIRSNENFRQLRLRSPPKELQSLKTISSELVRQNWQVYSDSFANKNNETFYEYLWDNWMMKFLIIRGNMPMKLLKDFIMNYDTKETIDRIANIDHNVQQKTINSEFTLVIKDLSNYSRIEYQKLCDKIGLHHKTFSLTKFVGYRGNVIVFDLHITKPTPWVWEWTISNPYPYCDVHTVNPYRNIWTHFNHI
jgi:hypothetical protein